MTNVVHCIGALQDYFPHASPRPSARSKDPSRPAPVERLISGPRLINPKEPLETHCDCAAQECLADR